MFPPVYINNTFKITVLSTVHYSSCCLLKSAQIFGWEVFKSQLSPKSSSNSYPPQNKTKSMLLNFWKTKEMFFNSYLKQTVRIPVSTFSEWSSKWISNVSSAEDNTLRHGHLSNLQIIPLSPDCATVPLAMFHLCKKTQWKNIYKSYKRFLSQLTVHLCHLILIHALQFGMQILTSINNVLLK